MELMLARLKEQQRKKESEKKELEARVVVVT